jgi:hypothetical protein
LDAGVIECTIIIGSAIEAYESDSALLARNEDVATEPCEVARRKFIDLFLVECRREQGAARAGEGAWIRRDDEDAFCGEPIEGLQSNVAQVVDCVDLTVVLVGHQDLAAVTIRARRRPKAYWRHSWSFKLGARASGLNEGDVSGRVNTRHKRGAAAGARVTRHDHVVAKCAFMVERNPCVLGCITVWDRRKRRYAKPIGRDLIDLTALCDVKVARIPHSQGWRESQVSFQARLTRIRRTRNRCEKRDIPSGVDRIDALGAVFGHVQFTRRSSYAYGPAPAGRDADSGKETWTRGVKESCRCH